MACQYCGMPVALGLEAHMDCITELKRRAAAFVCARCGAGPEADDMRWAIDPGVPAGVAGNQIRENWCPECFTMGDPPYRGFSPHNAN